jgi:tetratricopeptide (TPR) repeat protein
MKSVPSAAFFAPFMAAAAAAQAVAVPVTAAPAPAPAPPAQLAAAAKVIKDPAEYDAYMKAFKLTDPAARSAAFEAFISAYPASVTVPDALGEAMAAYQAIGDTVKVEATARRLLVVQPDDLRSLAILAFVSREAAAKGNSAALSDARDFAERGLRVLAAQRPAAGDPGDDKLRAQISAVLYGARGFALLNAGHYPEARDAYLKALDTGPDDPSDNYQLAIAELQTTPMNPDGFWYLARAINLSRAQKNEIGAIAITTFAQRKYTSFHGGIDGWDAIRLRAGASGPIPTGFAATVARAPTPAEAAVKAVRDNDPASLSIEDWEYVLSYRDASPANSAAAAKVWSTIQSAEHDGTTMIAIPVVIVSTSADGIEASISGENIASHVSDIRIYVAEPLQTAPPPGAKLIATGVISSYAPHPFRFVMTKARLAQRSAAASSK